MLVVVSFERLLDVNVIWFFFFFICLGGCFGSVLTSNLVLLFWFIGNINKNRQPKWLSWWQHAYKSFPHFCLHSLRQQSHQMGGIKIYKFFLHITTYPSKCISTFICFLKYMLHCDWNKLRLHYTKVLLVGNY